MMEMKRYRIGQIVNTISRTHEFDKEYLFAINTSDVDNGVMGQGTLTPINELKGQFKKTIQKDDILFSEIRPANRRFARVTIDDCHDFVVSTKLMVLRKFNQDVDLDYFYYCLTNQSFLGILQRRAENRIGSFPQITFDLLSEYSFPIPTLSEQKKIANIISSLDSKISLNRAINRNLEAMAKQLYDYWFLQFDFPDENGKPYKSSGGKMVWNEVLKREIPEGWEVKSVNDVSSICRGVSYKPNDLQESGVLILRGNNIENNHVVYDNNTAYLLPDLISDEQKIKKHDIIITMSSGSKEHIGKCAMFQSDSEHSFGAFLSKITPDNDCPYFLFLYLISQYFKQKIKSICNGTGINNLTNQTFDEVLFAFPEQRVLTEFEKVVQPIFDSIGINETEITSLTHKRDELLPLLMNGQVEVGN